MSDIDKGLKHLIREYYFSEAMALYKLYYDPLINFYEKAAKSENRKSDRDLTWVPLVFHCTDFEGFKGIVEEGFIGNKKQDSNKEPYVSFTELPIIELDRMKIRKRNREQIAIGFPRRVLENYNFSSVLYLNHNKPLKEILRMLLEDPDILDCLNKKCQKDVKKELKPFVELEDDLGALGEIRIKEPMPIQEAVWLLTTKREEKNKKQKLIIPDIESFEQKYGSIAKSYWHRSHQEGILGEYQFVHIPKETEPLTKFETKGEHYWKQHVFEQGVYNLNLPVGKTKESAQVKFTLANKNNSEFFEGPYNFIDIAKIIYDLLVKHEGKEKVLDDYLKYRLIDNIDKS